MKSLCKTLTTFAFSTYLLIGVVFPINSVASNIDTASDSKIFKFEFNKSNLLIRQLDVTPSKWADVSVKIKVQWSICKPDLFIEKHSGYRESIVNIHLLKIMQERIRTYVIFELREAAVYKYSVNEVISSTNEIHKKSEKEVNKLGVCIIKLEILPL